MVLLKMKEQQKKKNKIILVLLLLLSNKGSIFCQTMIMGKVIDDSSNVVFNANVTLYHFRTAKESTTEIDGTFFFTGCKNDDYRIIISAMGYAKIDTTFKLLSDTINLHIKLQSLDLHIPKVEWRGGIMTYEDSNKYLRSITISKDSEIFDKTYTQLHNYLISGQGSFKKSVLLVENTFLDREINKLQIQRSIDSIIYLTKIIEKIGNLIYDKKDKKTIQKYAAIFKVMTDTISYNSANRQYVSLPFRYDFDDVFGEKKWENMFVTKLLETKKGNCHSMPYLYKILCEELGVPCYLALAPNHIYIKHRSEKAGMYNTELTSASFPIDAWLMASGYITLEAIQNGIYMDALDDKKCIALCVLDLAKGYDKKYSDNDGSFIIKCCDLTLEYFPDCINALLFKAETKKKQFERLMKQRSIINPSVLRQQKDGKILWEEMAGLYGKIHKLGYRTMPEKMYVDWLFSLKAEREKYSNKQVTEMNKN
jgi:CarboxypepD_reg-like domain